jgi:hypothetical protein
MMWMRLQKYGLRTVSPACREGAGNLEKKRGAWNYIDIKSLCTICEPVHGRNISAKPTRYP